MRRWPFSDRRSRAAFLHAVDREFLVKAINFGEGKVAHGPIPSTAPYYDEKALVKYPYDPARARALLDEMGCKPGPDGVRHRFGIMLTPDGGGAWTRIGQYIKQALAEVGLEASLEATDWPTQSRRSGNWEFDTDTNAYGEYGDPAIGTSRFYLVVQYPQGRAADQPARLYQSGSGQAVRPGRGGGRAMTRRRPATASCSIS